MVINDGFQEYSLNQRLKENEDVTWFPGSV